MRPSEVRRMILEDHAALRIMFANLRDLLKHPESRTQEEHVRELGSALRQRFLRHLDLEDEHLVPALREIDAWGEERAARVSQEHEEQRSRFDRLLGHLQDRSLPESQLVQELEVLLRDLIEDMNHEETTVLNEDLLRDDPVSIEMEAG